jgi:nicotinic acid mononucleotide adenylyltransferase
MEGCATSDANVGRNSAHAVALQGRSVRYLTPDAVLAYIKTHRLYSAIEDGS